MAGLKIEFSSKVYTGRKSSSLLFRSLFLLAGAVILLTVIIKMLAGDLHVADYGGILFSVFLIWRANRSWRGAPQYVYTNGEIVFEEDRLTIRYGNTGAGKGDGNTKVIWYREIKSIEYGEALHCYRFITEGGADTFMYVLNGDEEQEIRKSIRKYTGFLVRVMEDSID